LPPHIFIVYQRSDPSKRFIAKKDHEQSNELDIFKLLNTFREKSEHIISLHESFQTQSTSWVILPEMNSVSDYVWARPDLFEGKVSQVCLGLIQGVAYLHKFCIAHRDIKPDNLVVDMNFSLKIIDFDFAMRVESEDEVVDGQCGTEGWMAPEMEKSRYSPIKADRWSTGQVLLYLLNRFRKENKVLRTTRKLTAYNPEQRLSMLQVIPSLSDVANIAVDRKASRSLEDTMEVDRENVMPATVKLKLSAPDGVLRSSSTTCDSRSVIFSCSWYLLRFTITIEVFTLSQLVIYTFTYCTPIAYALPWRCLGSTAKAPRDPCDDVTFR